MEHFFPCCSLWNWTGRLQIQTNVSICWIVSQYLVSRKRRKKNWEWKKMYWLFSIWYEWYFSRWIDITGWVASSSALINVTISINVLWKVLFVSDIFHWMHYQIVNHIMKSDTTEDSIDILNGFEPASIPFAHVSTNSIQKWTMFLYVRCTFFMSYLPSFSFLVINSLIFQQPNEIEMNSSWVPERNGHC